MNGNFSVITFCHLIRRMPFVLQESLLKEGELEISGEGKRGGTGKARREEEDARRTLGTFQGNIFLTISLLI